MPSLLDDLWDSREEFQPQKLFDLPQPARQYLEHAIALCSRNVSWTALTECRPHARVVAHGEWAELGLKIRDNGALEGLSLLRWGNPGGGSFRYVPFGGVVEEENTFQGYTIPTRIRVGYYAGTDRFETDGEFMRIAVDNATFL
jgi:hypothetical protein